MVRWGLRSSAATSAFTIELSMSKGNRVWSVEFARRRCKVCTGPDRQDSSAATADETGTISKVLERRLEAGQVLDFVLDDSHRPPFFSPGSSTGASWCDSRRSCCSTACACCRASFSLVSAAGWHRISSSRSRTASCALSIRVNSLKACCSNKADSYNRVQFFCLQGVRLRTFPGRSLPAVLASGAAKILNQAASAALVGHLCSQ